MDCLLCPIYPKTALPDRGCRSRIGTFVSTRKRRRRKHEEKRTWMVMHPDRLCQVRSVRYHRAVRQHPSVSHPDLLVQNTLRTFKRTSPIQKKMITVEKFKNIAEAFVVKLGFKGCKVPATEEQTMNLLDRKSTRLNSSHVKISY